MSLFDKSELRNKMDKTITFKVARDEKDQVKKTLTNVYEALVEKGYDPLNQIVGYLLTEDPTYITNFNNARTEIVKIDRDELLRNLLQDYLGI